DHGPAERHVGQTGRAIVTGRDKSRRPLCVTPAYIAGAGQRARVVEPERRRDRAPHASTQVRGDRTPRTGPQPIRARAMPVASTPVERGVASYRGPSIMHPLDDTLG